jgi:hypothetical protein
MNDTVTVLVAGPSARLHDLQRFLPDGWEVVHTVGHPDVVVLVEPARSAVTQACLTYPAASIVAVLGPYGDHDEVVRVLNAGADACVRSRQPAMVAAHVEACRRRQLASPWRVQVA